MEDGEKEERKSRSGGERSSLSVPNPMVQARAGESPHSRSSQRFARSLHRRRPLLVN